MPAGITVREDGTIEMAYAGQTPWHRLGVAVDHPMTAAEAMEMAGLDWQVTGRPVYTMLHSKYVRVPNKQAIVRDDTEEVFKIFSTGYKPVQNKDAFDFFDGVVGAGEAVYETAGSLQGGRRIWILARLPGDLDIGDGDLLKKYILLSNSHDGTTQVGLSITPVRVVCENTLSVALRSVEKGVKFRHTSNVLNRMNNTREFLGLVEAHFELFMRGVNRLASARFDEGMVRDVAATALEFNLDAPTEEQSKARREQVDEIVTLYHKGLGSNLPTADGTGWGAFNAVTEFVDHLAVVKGSKGEETAESVAVADRRLSASWFFGGRDVRQRAWDRSLELAVS